MIKYAFVNTLNSAYEIVLTFRNISNFVNVIDQKEEPAKFLQILCPR